MSKEEGILSRPAKVLLALLALALICTGIYFGQKALLDAADRQGDASGTFGAPTTTEPAREPSGDIAEPSEPAGTGPADPLSAAGLSGIIAGFRAATGGRVKLTKVTLTPLIAEFHYAKGRRPAGLMYNRSLDRFQSEQVTLVGTEPISYITFAQATLRPAIVPKLIRNARRRSGARDFQVVSLILQRGPIGRKLSWTVNGAGGGRIGLTYRANLAGRITRDLNPNAPPAAVPVPPGAQGLEEAQRILDCIQRAAGDIDEISACAEQ